MYEVEVKFRLKDENELLQIKQRLENIGAKFLEKVEEVDIYFSHPCRNFAETDEALRIRKIKKGTFEECMLTYKGPRVGSEGKTREEVNVIINSLEDMRIVLSKLGFNVIAEVKKVREVYTYENLTISLDVVERLGLFVEIETTTNSRELIEKCVEDIMSFASSLGLSQDRVERKTYLELILEDSTLS